MRPQRIEFILPMVVALLGYSTAQRTPWSYECVKNRCERVELLNVETAVSLQVCRIFCSDEPGVLWPKINGVVRLKNSMARLSPIEIQFNALNNTGGHDAFWKANEQRFREQLLTKIPAYAKMDYHDGDHLLVMLNIQSDNVALNHNTDERYHMEAYENTGVIIVKIRADTIFGARHGLETLAQLIVYDDIRHELQVVSDFEIEDRPVFAHRGFLLDTARNYYSVDSIKRTIDTMALVKLNVFHWHITDSHSFPLVLKSHPDLSLFGAYAPDKVYTIEDVKEVTEYGYNRGVLVLPEFDAPAHVGEGWQKKNATACFNYQPWIKYCVEPPCGQLDPTKDHMYDILEDIYTEMYAAFGKPDIFHMGGDEVSHKCWNASADIQQWMLARGWSLTEADFIKLWGHFQETALQRLDKVTQRRLPIIMWTSRLTDVPFLEQHLDKDRYIIQIWTTGKDPKIIDLLDRGYNVILSNYDALYLDCGFGSWVGEGNNWCSPYIGWEKVYKNGFTHFDPKYRAQFLGGEAALWSEQSDQHTLDSRVWPRLSAWAERLWANPTTSWREAEPRMLIHRERLAEANVAAEPLQPLWCVQNEGNCPI